MIFTESRAAARMSAVFGAVMCVGITARADGSGCEAEARRFEQAINSGNINGLDGATYFLGFIRSDCPSRVTWAEEQLSIAQARTSMKAEQIEPPTRPYWETQDPIHWDSASKSTPTVRTEAPDRAPPSPAVAEQRSEMKVVKITPIDPERRALLPRAPPPTRLAADEPPETSRDTRLVAVLPLDVTNAKIEKADRISLEESIRTIAGDLLRPLGYTVLNGDNTLAVLADNGVDPNKACEASCALQAARELKAAFFVSGTVATSEDRHLAFIRLFDSRTGAQKSSIRLKGVKVGELLDQFDTQSAKLFEGLGPSPLMTATPVAQVADDRVVELKRLDEIATLPIGSVTHLKLAPFYVELGAGPTARFNAYSCDPKDKSINGLSGDPIFIEISGVPRDLAEAMKKRNDTETGSRRPVSCYDTRATKIPADGWMPRLTYISAAQSGKLPWDTRFEGGGD